MTQSQMTATDRDALATAARGLAAKVQAGDVSGLQARRWPSTRRTLAGLEYVVGSTAPKLKGGTLVVEQVYLLDGTQLKRGADGSAAGCAVFLLAESSRWRRRIF